MIDARHDGNPPEMRRLLAIRRSGRMAGLKLGNGNQGLDSICIPGVQGNETPRWPEKLLCGA
jgi:hypothetical protein